MIALLKSPVPEVTRLQAKSAAELTLSRQLPANAGPLTEPSKWENLPANHLDSVVVVDRIDAWPTQISGVAVMAVSEYLQRAWPGASKGLRVYNLCGSHAYQSEGYYVSLLAPINGHKVLPDVGTMNDMRLSHLPEVALNELQALTTKCLPMCDGPTCVTNVYFGYSGDPARQELAKFLFYFFPCPLLQARFEFDGKAWQFASCRALALDEICADDLGGMIIAARRHFADRHASGKIRTTYRQMSKRYQIAVLVNGREEEPPSNGAALAAFEKAGADMGVTVRLLERADAYHVPSHDALLIRETTAVNHHSYEIARVAERAGLVVIDDAESILRCCNKVFLAQLMRHHAIPQPDTVVIHRGNLGVVPHLIGFPCVIKLPNPQFGIGVVKVNDMEELTRVCAEMLRSSSDLLVAQRYEFTEFDWRVGVLDGVPLYACRYYMANGQWQVIRRDVDGHKYEGRHETLNITDAPASVVRTAVAAANAVGRGLYGVDLKQFGDVAKVIEVNDNPNIDAGVEDMVLGPDLYRRVIGHFIKRIDSLQMSHGHCA
jgi:glutathione synthase/RimK-type ligase-like ATP-grasp enzyme